jgi:hypothetical protein
MLAGAPVQAAHIERTTIAGSEVMLVRIADQRSYWRASGFRKMTPPIRVSLLAHSNSKTVIYLKIGDRGEVLTHPGPDGSLTIQYPPSSESDRVSMAMYRENGSVGYTINDVRGIRWDHNGREYFHVYRASGPEPHAPLIGYEWPRDNTNAAAEASDRLTQILRTTPLPNGYWSSDYDIYRFRQLNRCQGCHWPDKRGARRLSDRRPPWATDASGLYTPLAVLRDYAPLSAESAFHDPNTADPYIQVRCGSHTGPTNAERLGSPGGYYYRCPDMTYPIGVRDLPRAIRQGDLYSQSVCDARRYLYQHLDPNGKRHFSAAIQSCLR